MTTPTLVVPTDLPTCSIIIPTRNQVKLLKTCIDGVRSSNYSNSLEIIIVDNDSTDKKTLSYLNSLNADVRIRVIRWQEAFNFSRINNMAAREATGEFLCFLNNDIEVLSPDWLEKMTLAASDPEIGAVGALLFYPDGKIQHAGVSLDKESVALHIGHHMDKACLEKFQLRRLYEVDGVTAACMVTKATHFRELNGFNEDDLKISFNDVDYCLRLKEKGFGVYIYPEVQLVHHESVSRKSDDLPENRERALQERNYMLKRWASVIETRTYRNEIPFSLKIEQNSISDVRLEKTRIETNSSVKSENTLSEKGLEERYKLLQIEYNALESHTLAIEHELNAIRSSRTWLTLGRIRNLFLSIFHLKQTLGRLLVSTKIGLRIYSLVRPKQAPSQEKISAKPAAHDHKQQFRLQAESRFEEFLKSGLTLTLPCSEAPTVSIVLVLYNQASLTLLCLDSIVEFADISVEIIIIDNASSDATDLLLSRCEKATIVRNNENVGFVHAVNQGAQLARGKNILLLNNDALLKKGALSEALNTLESEPNVGAVGGKIVLLDGFLQEAGSIIWRDGSCLGYGRGREPDDPEFMYRRDVDYCSGAFLMFPRALFDSLGGFDTDYAPAYYEESDFCVRLREQGYRIIYEPKSVILHYEFASSGGYENASKLQIAHRDLLCQKHESFLNEQLESSTQAIFRARTAGHKKNILVIDDRVPHVNLGAGYPRCSQLMKELAAMDVNVTFFPLLTSFEEWDDTYKSLPPNVEVMLYLGQVGLEDFLRSRKGLYDFILVSRSHNMKFVNEIIHRQPELFSDSHIIYDAEAITSAREVMQIRLAGSSISDTQESTMIRDEVSLAEHATKVVCVSEAEANIFREFGVSDVLVLGHTCSIEQNDIGFQEREDFLFVGALRDDNSPNVDSLIWFHDCVLPIIEKTLTTDFRILVVGDNTAPSLLSLKSKRLKFLGRLDVLTSVYNNSKVFIAPTRFAAGIPHKIHEAAANGVPAVVTEILAKQLLWNNEKELLVGSNAEAFAEACVRIYQNRELWSSVRDLAYDAVARDCNSENFRLNAKAIVSD